VHRADDAGRVPARSGNKFAIPDPLLHPNGINPTLASINDALLLNDFWISLRAGLTQQQKYSQNF
jgi:hypothetical protein